MSSSTPGIRAGRTPPILIAGPTASGKSALALDIAEKVGGLIINADSMQVYRELRILTARPDTEDEARVPHRLYGHVPASEAYSAGRFVREIEPVLAEAFRQGLTPIVVGGTGLYFKALLEGLAPIPDIDPDMRERCRALALELGSARLHDLLATRDRVMAERLSPGDTQRITRALEVLEATGRSLAEWQSLRTAPVIDPAAAVKLLVLPPREALQQGVQTRFCAMLSAGALDEVAALLELKLDDRLPATRAIGVPALARHLRGECSLSAATDAAVVETMQYVKRQHTWMKRHMMSWNRSITQFMESFKPI